MFLEGVSIKRKENVMTSSSRRISVALLFFIALIAAFTAAASPAEAPSEGPVPGRYIVVLEDAAVGGPAGHGKAPARVAELARTLARGFDLRVERTWGHALNGFVAEGLSEAEAARLARHPLVKSVEQDFGGPALSGPPNCYSGATFPVDTRTLPSSFSNSSQSINCSSPTGTCIDNWGIDRVDQRYLPRDAFYGWGDNGYAVHVYVIDTGIDHHREFRDHLGLSRVITSFGVDFTNDGVVTDCYGHGTHVAAIIAGRTYGVAKDALLIPVKFVQCNNYALSSWLISSFDYVRQHAASGGWRSVANLSGSNNAWAGMTSVQTAAQNLIASGVQLVQSAGNQGTDACSLSFGGTTDTLVVGGTDHNDSRWSSSNFGSCVDIWAPAALITSAAFQSGNGSLYSAPYCELTGTSMAAPHVTGALALYLDANASLTPAQLRSLVIGDATNGVLSGIGTGSPNRLLYLP